MEELNYWFGGIVAFFLTSYKLFEWWKKRKEKNNKNTLLSFANDSIEVEKNLKEIVENDVAYKAVINRSHNCGGKPTLGKAYYLDTITSTKKEEIAQFSDIRIDGIYLKIISFILVNDYIDVHRVSVDNGFLKKSWENDGVVFARFYPILLERNDFYFFKVSFQTIPTEAQLFECDLYFNKIKNIYISHHNRNK